MLVRDSGGGAVLSGPWMVGVSLVLPRGHHWVTNGLLDSYRQFARLHLVVLSALGISASAMSPEALARSRQAGRFRSLAWACFGSLSPWELVNAEGRKLVGMAQTRRKNGVLLVAGTLVGECDWSQLCHAMGHVEDERLLRESTVSLEEIQGSPIVVHRYASALTHALSAKLLTSTQVAP